MLIGVNCYLLTPEIGGLRTYFGQLFNDLSKNHPEHEIVYFYFSQNEAILKEFDFFPWNRHAVKLAKQSEIFGFLKKLDLFFCPLGSLWPRPVSIPSVVTIPDIQECFFSSFFSEKERLFREYNHLDSLEAADRIVTISNFSKKTFIEQYGVSPKKVRVSWLNADDSIFEPMVEPPNRTFELPPSGYLFYPANRWPHKNHDTLLHAMRYLKEARGLKVDLVATGFDVDGGPSLEKMAAKYEIKDQVHDFGYVSREALKFLYSKATLMVFPSLFEGFGLPLLEAMFLQCPVACSYLTSLPEIGADAVEYFDPRCPKSVAASIERLWLDPVERQKLIRRGKARGKHFSAQNMGTVHIEIFEDACRSFSKRRIPRKIFRHNLNRLRMFFKYRHALSAQEIIGNILRLLY